jgi:hypothetical protein
MSDALSSVPPVGGPPLMYPVPPVTPVQGKPVAPSSSPDQPTRPAAPQGAGRFLDILV